MGRGRQALHSAINDIEEAIKGPLKADVAEAPVLGPERVTC